MLLDIGGINALAVWTDPVQVLIDVRDAIFPDLILPFRRWKFVLQWRLRSTSTASDAVQGRGLTSLLIQRHLRQQVIDALFDWRFRVFVNIHPAVLVQIDPAIVIDVLLLWLLCRQRKIKAREQGRQKN